MIINSKAFRCRRQISGIGQQFYDRLSNHTNSCIAARQIHRGPSSECLLPCCCRKTRNLLGKRFLEFAEAREHRLVEFALRRAEAHEWLEGPGEILIEAIDRVSEVVLNSAQRGIALFRHLAAE